MERVDDLRVVAHTASELCVRESDGGGGECRRISGYAILFDVPSVVLERGSGGEEIREVIARGAVTRELLDGCDIKMTMFHDRQLILARSRMGKGTLEYWVDDRGVGFSFEAPRSVDGDKALELVRRGDVSGCSFMFSTRYRDGDFVERRVEVADGGVCVVTYVVRAVTGIYDFTLAADPAYDGTCCGTGDVLRELGSEGHHVVPRGMRGQVDEMRVVARRKLFV